MYGFMLLPLAVVGAFLFSRYYKSKTQAPVIRHAETVSYKDGYLHIPMTLNENELEISVVRTSHAEDSSSLMEHSEMIQPVEVCPFWEVMPCFQPQQYGWDSAVVHVDRYGKRLFSLQFKADQWICLENIIAVYKPESEIEDADESDDEQ